MNWRLRCVNMINNLVSLSLQGNCIVSSNLYRVNICDRLYNLNTVSVKWFNVRNGLYVSVKLHSLNPKWVKPITRTFEETRKVEIDIYCFDGKRVKTLPQIWSSATVSSFSLSCQSLILNNLNISINERMNLHMNSQIVLNFSNASHSRQY